MTSTVPYIYPINPLSPYSVWQRLYFNDPQISLWYTKTEFNCFLDYSQLRQQQSHFQRMLLLQQKQFQNLLLSKIVRQDTITTPLPYYFQEDQGESQNTKVEEIVYKTEEIDLDRSPVFSQNQQINTFDLDKDAIVHVLDDFLSHFGKVGKDGVEKLKETYAHDIKLTRLLDVLISRYRSASKSREDMVRFVMRKSITWLRDQTRFKSHVTAKAASITLCHKYFIKDPTDIQNSITARSDNELLSLLLPYKKNARHPVVNGQFIKEIFSSTEFCQDYLEYLKHYSEIMEQENEKKIKQFAEFLVSCIQENCFYKVLNYKRLPWLNLWIETSQGIGYEIYDQNACKDEDEGKLSLKREKQIKSK